MRQLQVHQQSLAPRGSFDDDPPDRRYNLLEQPSSIGRGPRG